MGHGQFQGTKVRLRAIEPEDWEPLHALSGDSDAVRLSSFVRLPESRDSARSWAQEASKPANADAVTLGIESLAGVLVGTIDVGRADLRNRVFEYGIGLGREHWRNGYGSEALYLLLRFYFAELGYQKAESSVFAFNEASLRFHDVLGFVREGIRRRCVFAHGEYYDKIMFGMTSEEFLSRYGRS